MAAARERSRGPEGRIAVRVRYPETDRMGVAWHGHYLAWFELGRTELMRELGCTYAALEEQQGIYFPVIEVGARYHGPARYDERLDVETRLVSAGRVRVRFEYAVRSAEGRMLATGFSQHAAVDGRGRPRRLPEDLARRLGGRIASNG